MTESRRVALVTGASRGLGVVIAQVLAEQGYHLVIGGRDAAALARVAAHLARHDTRTAVVVGDITDPDTRSRLIAAAETFGGLDVLVNNASMLGPMGPLLSFDLTLFSRLFPVNVGAPLALIQGAVPLLEQRHGLIVNITSDAAVSAYAGWGPYGTTKAALELITRTLATELSDRHVSAVLVDPGDMRTQMHQEAFAGEDIADRPLPDVTTPFWRWLFGQDRARLSGRRLLAQTEEAQWRHA